LKEEGRGKRERRGEEGRGQSGFILTKKLK
jgi:hypothetical protein